MDAIYKDGILYDDAAVGFARAVGKHNCLITLEANADRVEHFRERVKVLGKDHKDVVILIVNVDDPNGQQIAEVVMPDHNWQEYRDRGETPFMRGIFGREGTKAFLDMFDKEASEDLAKYDDLAVVVIDHCVARVF